MSAEREGEPNVMSIRTKATRLAALVGAAALLGGIALSAGVAVHAQTPATSTPASNIGGPSSVPSARFYGSVTTVAGSPALTGSTITATIGGVACGFGTVSGGTYIVDVQAISGCTGAGATVSFSVGGSVATQTGTLPTVEGSAVSLNLTVAPPATPTPAPTTAPPPPPPPPTATKTPPPPAPSATAAQRPAAPAAQKPAAPVAQKPGAAAARPAARPALPNTGTGGTAGQNGAASLALLGILLGALALSATGLVAYRRTR